jgi:group I intron endonuclease
MNESKVYIITLLSSGIFYIGSTQNLKERLKSHLQLLRKNKHYNTRLQNAWFEGEELLVNSYTLSSREEAYNEEERLIKSVYNSDRRKLMANTLLGSRFGDSITNHQLRPEIIEKRRLTQRKQWDSMSDEERVVKYGKPGILNGMYGRTHTPEVKARLSAMHMGHSYNKGIKLSKEHVEKIRVRQRLRTGSKNSFYGKQHSERTKQLLRDHFKGKPGSQVKSLVAGGIHFKSRREAAKHFGISESLVTHRLKKAKYKDWYNVDNSGD